MLPRRSWFLPPDVCCMLGSEVGVLGACDIPGRRALETSMAAIVATVSAIDAAPRDMIRVDGGTFRMGVGLGTTRRKGRSTA